LKATRLLGVLPEDLFFLSYPDGGMAEMPNEVANPYTQPFTGKTETYGLLRPDYRSQISGRPAPYLRSSALDDSVELLRSVRPAEIYVTAEFDGHPDHRAWCVLIRQAAKIAEFRGKIFAYLIHSADGDWPTPRGVNPDMPFESHIINGRQVPADCPWPPSDRRPLPREESALKLRAIRCYDLEMRLAGTYVESFVKSEEIFWRIQADANSSLKKVRPDTQKT
jgi:LmbE family N-acetylglucosaminyl deacetylase